jgi:hypothetical protein
MLENSTMRAALILALVALAASPALASLFKSVSPGQCEYIEWNNVGDNYNFTASFDYESGLNLNGSEPFHVGYVIEDGGSPIPGSAQFFVGKRYRKA